MNRRRVLGALAVLGAWVTLSGQALQREWKRAGGGNLTLQINAQDLGSAEAAELLSKQLHKALPDTDIRVTRDASAAAVADVMAKTQGGLAFVAYDVGLQMYRGEGPFRGLGPVELRVLVENYKYQLLCRAEFAREQAYVIAQAIMQDPEMLKLTVPDRPAESGRDSIPTHPGAAAFLKSDVRQNR
jgi:TRAP-type uncharacterized transport system substrate-binding protein